jgi:ATP-binding cassette subfamily B protein
MVGPTGAGKSTIARMLCRLADPDTGFARLGGVDLTAATPEGVRRRVVLVAQEGHLVPGTLADNVRLGHPEAGEAEVRAALAAVGALDWALGLPEGLTTPAEALGADGRQLVGLARVALTDPAAVVLDEATSALDPAAERRLEDAMRGVLAGRAVLVIAHRPGTAARCYRVLHIDSGRRTA